MKSLYIKNNIHNNKEIASEHHVVYQYTCNRGDCNVTHPSYIGYTTCSINNRFKMHTQNSSSIKKHLQELHNINTIKTADLIPHVKILHKSADRRNLILTEAIYIKQERPNLNAQNEGSEKILKIFKH